MQTALQGTIYCVLRVGLYDQFDFCIFRKYITKCYRDLHNEPCKQLHLPSQRQEGLQEVLASPQLQQSLSALTQAVHSDQLPVLLASLGLEPSALSGGDALELLCKAMEQKFKE